MHRRPIASHYVMRAVSQSDSASASASLASQRSSKRHSALRRQSNRFDLHSMRAHWHRATSEVTVQICACRVCWRHAGLRGTLATGCISCRCVFVCAFTGVSCPSVLSTLRATVESLQQPPLASAHSDRLALPCCHRALQVNCKWISHSNLMPAAMDCVSEWWDRRTIELRCTANRRTAARPQPAHCSLDSSCALRSHQIPPHTALGMSDSSNHSLAVSPACTNVLVWPLPADDAAGVVKEVEIVVRPAKSTGAFARETSCSKSDRMACIFTGNRSASSMLSSSRLSLPTSRAT